MEEPNKACLNQLGRWWKHHTEVKNVHQLSDLFLLLAESVKFCVLSAGSCSRAIRKIIPT